MKFKEAFEKMKSGAKVKLPGWGGYWYWDSEKETIMMRCRQKDPDQGDLLDIRETQRVEYTLKNGRLQMRKTVRCWAVLLHSHLQTLSAI